MPLVLITTCLLYRNLLEGDISCMGDELGSATDIDRFPVFRTVYTNFHLHRERGFSELSEILGQQCPKKMVIFNFLGYLGEVESDSQTVWTCICTIVPRSVLPIFKSILAVAETDTKGNAMLPKKKATTTT